MPYRTHALPAACSIPAGYEVSDEPGCLRIAWRARDQPLPGAATAFIGTCGMLVAHLLLDQREIFLWVLVALVCGLAALWQLGDRVQIEVRGFSLIIGKSPITPQARVLAAGEIDQLYCVLQHGEKKHTYELWCELRGGARLRLVHALDSADAALYLEEILERRLGIADRPVEGELRAGR